MSAPVSKLKIVKNQRPVIQNLITVASGKGGVGKTWFASTLAHAMAFGGKRVLLFDGDLSERQVGGVGGHDETAQPACSVDPGCDHASDTERGKNLCNIGEVFNVATCRCDEQRFDVAGLNEFEKVAELTATIGIGRWRIDEDCMGRMVCNDFGKSIRCFSGQEFDFQDFSKGLQLRQSSSADAVGRN